MSTPHHPSGGAVLRARLLDDVRRARRYDIGFPGACDITYPDLAEWLTGHLLNNVGDPGDPGHGRNHTKALERQVIDIVADLFRAPAGRWGYVTSGASEGTEHALDEAWQQFPDLVVYTSEAAHPVRCSRPPRNSNCPPSWSAPRPAAARSTSTTSPGNCGSAGTDPR